MKERGLKGGKLIIADASLGLVESVADPYPEAKWRRCVVHWYRNMFSHAPSTKLREVAVMLKVIHAAEDAVSARDKASAVVEKFKAMNLTEAAHRRLSRWVLLSQFSRSAPPAHRGYDRVEHEVYDHEAKQPSRRTIHDRLSRDQETPAKKNNSRKSLDATLERLRSQFCGNGIRVCADGWWRGCGNCKHF
jgi:hypothetical protein